MLTVYKASAGSGKTFQLVVEYLKLILENPNNYKHILAVTFTNKATNEMKSRILEQLYQLASGQKSNYISPLQQNNDLSEQYIRQRAKQVLKNILHDYNRFSINTIDSFTQKVIKSFNRELGISPNFTVELDSELILEEAVDRMFAKISDNNNLLNWLREFSREKIETNKSQRIDDDIKNLGRELFKESFQVFFPEEGESVYKRENLKDFGKELRQIKSGFENTFKKKGENLFQRITESGFSVDDFTYKKTGIAGYIQNTANGVIKEAGARVLAASEEVEKWYSAKHKQAAEIHNLVEHKLQPGLIDLLEFFSSNFERYNTTLAVLSQIRMLGILTDLKEEIHVLLKEKGILQMSDSNLLLSKIIGQSDSPFVYEKIGNFYKHFMLDEFQDTSGLQWNNFKPLLINSLAEGHQNLIVGDVKQSIYRWRNSDWSILAEQLDSDFTPAQKQDFTLKKNWRSDRNIIDFNNAVFGNLKNTFEEYLFNGLANSEASLEKFKKVYDSYLQEPGKADSDKQGYIQANFLPKDEFREASASLLVKQVKHLQDKGIRAEEIVILIRKNREGTPIIEEFLAAAKLPENKAYNLSVLSNESLFLHASKGVLFVIEIIRHLIDPENVIIQASLLQLWLGWLKPELQKRGIPVNIQNGQNMLDFNEYSNWHLQPGFREQFKNELEKKLTRVKTKVLLSSLDETVTQICALFGIFHFESELPFLQTLIDKSGELKSTLSNDLSNLLFWWNEKGYKSSVNVNEKVNSIRLLTVHKSKGLEFKAVLLPFLNWETSWSGTNAPILWCKAESEPFNQFPLLPIQAGKNMEASEFSQVYYNEKVNNYIDTLNLVYVAFTRAKSVLIMNCPEAAESKSGNSGSGKPVNYLLYKALLKQISEEPFKGCLDEEKQFFEYGTIPESKTIVTESGLVTIKTYRFKDFSEKIKLRLSGEDFLMDDEKHHSVKNIGKLVHEILSEIVTEKDVKKACLKAFHDGKIDKAELEKIQQTLKENLALKEVKKWFDGTYQILNERDLLTSKKLLRPDRIMVSGKHAIVVDYKTGEKSNKYNKQVQLYAKTLLETGFKKVSAFLWYLHLNEVEKVTEIKK
ncbi:UvrD-helicase domain-containing protein [Prolixibacteraceae bacterium Z1-6]|uniref:DNA 3'-5' helicase n=1 Tax=Draconibacterium aestuarii TaxID=2998507 RepID=A0A9X3J6V1_9BACT|nr:UvrD-helicase domain-containing protein [Prolixibacteraceae bacterium Z1-6]